MKNLVIVFIVLFTTTMFCQSLILKWETPVTQSPGQSISYLEKFYKTGGGVFFITKNNIVEVYDGSSHTLKYTFNIQSSEYINSQSDDYMLPAAQDYNGDGITDIFLRNNTTGSEQPYTLHIVDPTNGSIIAQFDQGTTSLVPRGVSDVDGDGKLELLISKKTDNNENSYLVYSTNLVSTAIKEIGNNIPNNYKLMQNYPNPFNPTTTIEYEITKPENVKINIYDSVGRLVKELINEQSNSGNHSTVWNGKDNFGTTVASGTYYYQIKVGDYVQAKKMILIK